MTDLGQEFWKTIRPLDTDELSDMVQADSDILRIDSLRNGRLLISNEDMEAGYAIEKAGQGDAILRSSLVDDWLLTRPSPVLCVDKLYEQKRIDWIVRQECRPVDYVRFKLALRHGGIANEEKIALASVLRSGDSNAVVGKTSYFSTMATNEACTKALTRSGSTWRDFRSMFPVDKDSGEFLGLSDTSFSNQVGGSTLAFTSDRRFVIWRQIAGSHRSLGKMVPTGSGSIIWDDYNENVECDLLTVVKTGMARELREEAGISAEIEASDLMRRTMTIGYFRWIDMGGLPEFIGVTNLGSISSNELVPDEAEVSPLEFPLGTISDPIRSTSDVLLYCNVMKQSGNLSVPLHAIVNRLEEILTRHDAIEAKATLMEFLGIK